MSVDTDVLVIGCGVAGAAAALALATDRGCQVLVVTRSPEASECNTLYAQGGIVARGADDSPDLLVEDIMAAGAGASLRSAARIVAEEGPPLVDELLIQEAGVSFDADASGAPAYTREGGHSRARILHVGDATGRALEEALLARLKGFPNVTIRCGATAVDLITTSHHIRDPLAQYEPTRCLGAYVLDQATGAVETVTARATILAAGGLGRIYKNTTNPPGARGDGLAMAHRAGVRVVNAEYIQFHPTTLAVPGANNFLISEAVRGEGARLRTPDGRAFMEEYAPEWGDLAPRDVVARAIHHEMVMHGYPHVLLDLSGIRSSPPLPERFPTIYQNCLKFGIDISSDPAPVVPAAHYVCGGVLVDSWGRTTVKSLYAVGEVSCTGLHGANRLASTSLLEGLVWGRRAGRRILDRGLQRDARDYEAPPWMSAEGNGEPDPALMVRDAQNLQDIMWLYVGLARSAPRLARALDELTHLRQNIDAFYRANRITDALTGLRNMAQAAGIVALSAWQNRHSRGTHYREDAMAHESPSEKDFARLEDAADVTPSRSEY